MDSIVGKIYSVSCENFVTYDQITIYPGKYLNLILGPNGTGKSSLVAAIILGMGGNPKLLSRSSDLRDYVKNGKGNAWIEVKIYIDDKERTSTFRRSFDLSGKSVFKVNGATMTQKQYVTTIAQYNIQIDNPCQFLPQDKVQNKGNCRCKRNDTSRNQDAPVNGTSGNRDAVDDTSGNPGAQVNGTSGNPAAQVNGTSGNPAAQVNDTSENPGAQVSGTSGNRSESIDLDNIAAMQTLQVNDD